MGRGSSERWLPVAELSARDEGAWRDLVERAGAPNPFFEPMFVIPGNRHLREGGDVALVVIEDEDGWLACMPVTAGRWRGPIRAVGAWRTRYTFSSTPLLRAGADAEAVDRLIAAARSLSRQRIVVIERFREESPFGVALRAVTAGGGQIEALSLPIERALLKRREDGDYLSVWSRRRRHEARRLRRRLEEASDGELEAVDLSNDPDSAAIFLALEASGWKGREGTALASDPADAQFFCELCDAAIAQDRLEMLAFRAGDHVIAMLCNLRADEGAYSFKTAYDEAYSQFSPGLLLEVENFDFFHASGSAWIDSCAEPDNEQMNRIWPDRRKLRSVVLTERSFRGKLEAAALGAAGRAQRRARRK